MTVKRTMIETRQLCKRYGNLVAVDGISFKVEPGQVLGFLGPNGAGKSTTMKMLAGFLAPTSGSASVGGFDVEKQPLEAKRVVGYLPEGAPSYGEMSVHEFLEFIADVRGLKGELREKRLDDAIARLHLERVLEQPIDTLSKGFKRRVGLAQAILHDPAVLILDEPTDGLDPNQKHEVRTLINAMARDKTIIVSTHLLEEVHAVCTRAIIIAVGPHPRRRDAGRARSALALPPGRVADRRERQGRQGCARARRRCRRDRGRSAGRAHHRVPEAGTRDLRRSQRRAHQPGRRRARARARRRPARRGVPHRHPGSSRQGGAHMSGVITVFKRELKSYFATPVAYVFIVIFLILSGAFTFYLGNFYERGQADLQPFFNFHPWLYLFLVPAVSMRLWAEERKSGTIELLLTLPVTMWQAVLGKFLAAWAFIGIALVLTFPIWITVNYLGSPDNGVIFASYIGSFLMAGAFLAIGSCISATTRNQVVAFILTVVVCFLLLLAGFPLVLDFFRAIAPQGVVDAVSGLSFLTHFTSISKGVIDLRDLIYFLLMIGVWLYANAVVIDYKKAA